MSCNYQDAPRESQQEYFGKVHTDNKETLYNALKRIEELEKENAELRNNGFTVSAMTEQQLKVAIEKGEQLEKENAELKEKNRQLNNEVEDLTAYCNQIGKIKTDVLKLFEHIVAR